MDMGKDNQTEYAFKRIVAKRNSGNTVEYLLEWEKTWEPADHLANCAGLIKEFEDREAEAQKKRDSYSKRKSRQPLELDESENCGVTGFDRNLEPEEIIGVVDYKDINYFLIKWKECEESDLVSAEEVKARDPNLVIDFYEKRIVKKPTSPSR